MVCHHPSATLELLAYMLTIIKASQQYDGLYWRASDTNYRLTAAATGNRTWSRLDTDLFTRVFTGRARLVSACSVCDSLSHPTVDCPEAPSTLTGKRHDSGSRVSDSPAVAAKRRKVSRSWAPYTCAEFISKGSCSYGGKFKFRHSCGPCGGDHPARLPSRSCLEFATARDITLLNDVAPLYLPSWVGER